MNKLEEKFKKNTAQMRLSTQEKSQMRASLSRAMDIRSSRPFASPFYFWMRSPRLMGSLAALVLIVSAASGTVFAANGSLPGDLLYPVKIGVTEQFETVTATSPQAKVAVNTALALRRVQEAKILYARGDLTATTTAELKENFDAHAALALASAAAIETPAATLTGATTTSASTSAATATSSTAPTATSSASISTPDAAAPEVAPDSGSATSTATEGTLSSGTTSTHAPNTHLHLFAVHPPASTTLASTSVRTRSATRASSTPAATSSLVVTQLRAVLEQQAQTLDDLSKKETEPDK